MIRPDCAALVLSTGDRPLRNLLAIRLHDVLPRANLYRPSARTGALAGLRFPDRLDHGGLCIVNRFIPERNEAIYGVRDITDLSPSPFPFGKGNRSDNWRHTPTVLKYRKNVTPLPAWEGARGIGALHPSLHRLHTELSAAGGGVSG